VENDQQAIELINSTKYGVMSSVFTQSPERAELMT